MLARITQLKSRFFLTRLFTYFVFILAPVWAQKTLELDRIAQVILILCYIIFLTGQWYLLGKEVDHRFKIYYRTNSSVDRIIYRVSLGHICFILYFGLLNFVPKSMLHHFYWGTWVVLGLFYSWPTRGKIVQQSVTGYLSEFRFLDRFEKTVLFLVIAFFVVSFPHLPEFDNMSALKLYLDPNENFHHQIWTFLDISYFPFRKFPSLFRFAFGLHFYFVYGGFMLCSLYALARYFFSRRLSLLAIFALLSSWSFSKALVSDFSALASSSFLLVWVWSNLWVVKSATYRSGLFWGLIQYRLSLVDVHYLFLVLGSYAVVFYYGIKEQGRWFKAQLVKYGLLGSGLGLVVFLAGMDNLELQFFSKVTGFLSGFFTLIDRKAFFTLSFVGFGILLNVYLNKRIFSQKFQVDFRDRYSSFLLSFLSLMVISFVFKIELFNSMVALCALSFLSIVPIDWIFEAISKLRYKRNLIYAIYIIICLLDSHFEGRVKIFLKNF